MSEKLTLRPYQKEAVDAAFAAIARGTTRPAIVLPTGTGKSLTMAEVARRVVKDRGGKVLVLAHRGELLKQIQSAVGKLDDSITVGVVKAEVREYDADVVVASVQTLAAGEDHLSEIDRRDIVLVDEAHHYAATSYRQVLMDAGVFDLGAEVPAVGFTATMWRSDGGLENIWDEVVYEKDIKWAIENGFLVTPRAKVVVSPKFDLSEVRTVAGDFVAKDLEEVMMASVESTVDSYLTHCSDKPTIVFASGVDHAYMLAEKLTAAGYPSEAVVGSMTTEERNDVYDRFNSGDINSMVTVTVLTEGADFPRCSCVLMARPTQSKSLYIQMVGRALRLYEGKDEAFIIDLSGATRKMSLASLTDVYTEASVEYSDPEGNEVDEPEGEPEPKTRNERTGILELEEIDILRNGWDNRNNARWLKTTTGKMFLPGKRYYSYVQFNDQNQKWYALTLTTAGPPLGNVHWNFPCDTQHEAMEVAESKAKEIRDLPLRSENQFKNIAPTPKAVEYAEFLGIPDPNSMTRARLQDEISIVLASKRLGA